MLNKKQYIKKFARHLEAIYKLFKWKWVGKNDKMVFPTTKTIEELIWNMIKELRHKEDIISSGGITVSKEDDMYTITWSLEKTIYLNQKKIDDELLLNIYANKTTIRKSII